MKALTLQKRLSKLNVSKQSKSYQIIKDVCFGTNNTFMFANGVVRPCKTSGSGRFTTNLDYTDSTSMELKMLGLKIEVGNDAPRGGATGKYIKMLTKIQY